MTHPRIPHPKAIGNRVADSVTTSLGTWKFVLVQTIITLLWLILNTIAWRSRWDPYPFILLNLCYSFQAGYTAPLILMSNRRAAERDHLRDDLEAQEVSLLLSINQRQLDILEHLHQEIRP
jgi:uncharacterized membrane protein